MKMKTLSKALSAALAASMLIASGSTMVAADENVINLYSFTDEVPKMLQQYIDEHPDFGYTLNSTIIATTDGLYQPALDAALAAGGNDAPDIYCAEAAFVLKYTQGEAAGYAETYANLGIDLSQIEDAGIAPYSIEIGTNNDGNIVGLGYQATGGAFMYRRSIAMDAFGTDKPEEIAEIIGAGSGNWDKFFEAAETLKEKGFAIISGDGDLWHPVENSSEQGWIVDGKLHIDPKREEFLDLSKKLKDNGYTNDTRDWQDAWYADMKGEGEKGVFGFFGPAWLINYTLAPNCGGAAEGEGTYGDWAVCASPVGFFWGGTWLLGNKDSDKKEAIAELINWVTLDASEDGLQHKWANGGLYGEGGTKDVVASEAVMTVAKGELDFLHGQNMFPTFIEANQFANGKNLTQYDETINLYWRDIVRDYTAGKKTKEEAVAALKQQVSDNLGIDAE